MKGHELRSIIERDPILSHHFQGVFARDTLPSLERHQNFAIVNTQKDIGEHWQLCIRPESSTIEIFDPLGWKPEHEKLLKESDILRGVTRVILSETQFQPASSQKCGLYCIYVAHHRIYNLDVPFSNLLSDIFTDNLDANDALVTHFIASLN